jgi:hypothetical protein
VLSDDAVAINKVLLSAFVTLLSRPSEHDSFLHSIGLGVFG